MDTNVKNYELEIDTAKPEGPESFKKICIISSSFDRGETMDSWNDLCNALANNLVTAINPTWGITFKFDSEDEAKKFIIEKKFAVGKDTTAKVKITNKLEKKTIEFLATLSNIADEVTAEAVTEITLDLKVADASTFKVSEYMPA